MKEARIHELLKESQEFKADGMNESFQSEISPHNNMEVNNVYFDSQILNETSSFYEYYSEKT